MQITAKIGDRRLSKRKVVVTREQVPDVTIEINVVADVDLTPDQVLSYVARAIKKTPMADWDINGHENADQDDPNWTMWEITCGAKFV